MPTTPTYPGVYIEEIPSGVRSIAGVSTSVAAFVDAFKRGLADKAVRVFSFGDFEREFGGLDARSEASYAIQQFFLNGGTEAWVVRCAGNSAAAGATLLDGIGGATSLALEAGRGTRSNPGLWGRQLRVQVTPLSGDRYNLAVFLVESRNGQEAVVAAEEFRGLTNAAGDPRNARTVINDEAAGSRLVRVTQAPGTNRPLATGTVSGDLSTYVAPTATSPQLRVTIGTAGSGTATLASSPASLAEARRQLESAIRAARPELRAFSDATVSVVENRLRILAGPSVADTQIRFEAGGSDPTAATLGLSSGATRPGRLSGNVASVTLPPAANVSLTVTIGAVAGVAVTLTAGAMGDFNAVRTEFENRLRAANAAPEFAQSRVVLVSEGTERRLLVLSGVAGSAVAVTGADAATWRLDNANSADANALVSAQPAGAINLSGGERVAVSIGGLGPHNAEFVGGANNLTDAAARLQGAIRAAAGDAAFTGARVAAYTSGPQSRLVAIAGAAGDAVVFSAAPTDLTTVTQLRLTSATGATANVQSYAFGAAAVPNTAQGAGTPPTEVLPDANALIGELNTKRGLYALEDADLFNLLCLPRAATLAGDANPAVAASGQAVLANALAYCEKRRAFLLVDTPINRDDPEEITQWLGANGSLRHRNAALFYPRVKIPDPLDEFRLRSCGASGTVAGLFARIDSARGVWKAPAGTEAVVRGVPELEDLLTDQENGALNPLAINCLRNFPIYGNVVWGARTLDGSDQAASEWKYIPVRRLALFIEESLFRGLKWVVFEPNDEPLWAQIRLNVGAFMQNLFRQGAFQGSSPRDAYFVKCDKETTTQNDINLGIVNILVGFAPLKPAEFVILKLQQMAGQIQT